VLAPVAVEGFVIPAGWLLRLCIRESHRDPAIFAEPDRFDPDRFRGRAYSRLEYSPFGASTSRHACLGELLAKTIARVFLVEVARGFAWRVVGDGPREFDGWHWTPGPRFRIAIAPRASVA
jgi:cytochrome P450